MGRTLSIGSHAAKALVAVLAMLGLLLVSACSETADDDAGFRAVYSGTVNGGDMTVLGTAGGNLSFTIEGEDTRGLHVDGKDYIIFGKDKDQIVIEGTMISELLAESMPEGLKKMLEASPIKKVELRNDGETEVNGRKGIGYRNAASDASGPFFVVISEDPKLKPFAKAMSKQFRTSIALNPMAKEGIFDDALKIIESGFPIALGAGTLTEFETTDVKPETFKLPGKPLDKEATRKALIKRGMIPEKPIELPKEVLDNLEKRLEAEAAE